MHVSCEIGRALCSGHTCVRVAPASLGLSREEFAQATWQGLGWGMRVVS